MLNTCEKYAAKHNLVFSTDPNPNKSKTKCLAFLRKKRNLKPVQLCGNSLPWVNTCKHLGFHLSSENIHDLRAKDTMIKRQHYISRNNELIQEFQFTDPVVRFKMNLIYNSHFSGSPLWDLFSSEIETFYKTLNISVRRMFELPNITHTSLIEPISEEKHMKTMISSRFVSFITSIQHSAKHCIRNMFKVTQYNCLSVTGRTLRKLMFLCQLETVDMLSHDRVQNIRYRAHSEEE